MRRVPLVSGSRILVAPVEDEDEVLRPPLAPARLADTTTAVQDALRFPLSGPSLDDLARGARRATLVVDSGALPYPGARRDPRQEGLAAAIDELERSGLSDGRQTILLAGGLERRLGRRGLEHLLPPPRARSFRGRVVVHDVESRQLVTIAERDGRPVRVNRELVETDLVLAVTAAETIVSGGPGAFLGACDAATVRAAAAASSLLEAAGSPEWDLALAVEEALARRAPLAGVSLVLDHPRGSGALRGYPEDDRALARALRSDLRIALSLLPGPARRALLERPGRGLAANAAFAGPPSVAHSEALLHGVELRGCHLRRPVDALVVGAPWYGPHVPRAAANPITVAAATLGLALRLYRDTFPIVEDGTLVLLHPLSRSFRDAEHGPYQDLFATLRAARDPFELERAERAAAANESALADYRAGRACHPLMPYADWAGCTPALSRLGRVVVAGCRDATSARTLGFVPTRSVRTALEMAHGVAGGSARVGVLLGPPYPPLVVG